MSLVDRVSDLLAEVVAEEVMPRFHALAVDDIEKKPTAGDPDDIVTVADREVERRLEAALSALLPGSLAIGEEAVHTQPQLLNRLAGSEPVWLIDPIDGTRNFARGDDAFGVMIALVLSEAGGCVEHLDGRPYAPSARNEVTILAGTSSVCATVQSWLR